MTNIHVVTLNRCIKVVLLNGVKVQRRSKFETISNGKNNKVNLLGMERHEKLSPMTSSSDLHVPLRGERSKKFKI